MASLLNGERINIAEAAERCGVHRNTIHRWNRVGHRGHKLRLIRLGGRTYVRIADLERFIEALSDPPSREETEADATRRASIADAWLESQGL